MGNLIRTLTNLLSTYPPDVSTETKQVICKEYLQAYVLEYIFNHRQYQQLSFYGGTCARMLFDLNRFSEDIDLHNQSGIDLTSFGADVTTHLRHKLLLPELDYHAQVGRESHIARFTLRFPILYQLGLSPHTDSRLYVKVEISSHPQTNHTIITPKIIHGLPIALRHFDQPSLMSGKMLACLERNFQLGSTNVHLKGRDWYDLWWYMQADIQPFAPMLHDHQPHSYSVLEAIELLQARVKNIQPNQLAIDLRPLFTHQAFIMSWIENYHSEMARLFEKYLSE